MSRHAQQVGWYFYDWANSGFSSTVVTTLLPVYLTALATQAADRRGLIHPLGVPVDAGAWWSYLVSLSVILQILVLPVAGAVADYYSHRRKQLLALFAYLGALATIAMFFIVQGNFLLGGLLFVVANVTFGASVVVYNAFLPDIATEQERDAVSSKGWGLGYLGGGLLLAGNLVLLRYAAALGLTEAQALRINLCSAGVWWALFSAIPLATLKNRAPAPRPSASAPLMAGFRQLRETVRDLRHYPQALVFLLAYLVYNDAIQAVIALSGQFGSAELNIPTALLALATLMVQFVAFFGSLAFNWIAAALGSKRALLLSLAIWTATLIAIYGWVRSTTGFFIAAAVIAVVLGGSQALSRSLFSLMIPKSKEAEYFSLYEISDKGTAWMAPLVFGLTRQFTHSYRLAILSLIVFFLAGMPILARVNVPRQE